jgi:hypothetical protein
MGSTKVRGKWSDAIFSIVAEPRNGAAGTYHRVAVNGFLTYRWFEEADQATAYIESVRAGRIDPDFSQGGTAAV